MASSLGKLPLHHPCSFPISLLTLARISIGDVIDLLFSLLVIRSASEASLPSSIQSRMMLNLALDFLVGLVPILGDLADAAYKANTRNAIILEDYLRERGAENIKKQGITPPRDMSLPEEYEQQPELNPSTAVVEFTGHGRQTETVIQGGDVEAQRKKSKKSKKHRPKEHESSGHGSHGQEPSGPHGSSRHGSSSGGHHSSGEHHSSGR